MDGYYRRRSSLPFEEIRPLEINEIEFVSDDDEFGPFYPEEDLLIECSGCGEEVIRDEDEFEDNDEENYEDEENYCEQCCRYLNEN